MPKFSVKTLLLSTLVVACLSVFATHRNQATYFSITVFLPVAIGIFARYLAGRSKMMSVSTVFVSAILLGSVMFAYGSYFRTYIVPSDGILIGDGWHSVASSALLGAFIGCVCGLFSTLLYFIITSTIDLIPTERNAG